VEGLIAIAKNFFRSGNPDNPPCPPLKRGETSRNFRKSSPLKKGDSAGSEGFENLHGEGIYGKRYK
jgi:hypothetical protein